MKVFVALDYKGKEELTKDRIKKILYGIKGTKEVHFNKLDDANVEIFADWDDVQQKLDEIRTELSLTNRDTLRSEILTPL